MYREDLAALGNVPSEIPFHCIPREFSVSGLVGVAMASEGGSSAIGSKAEPTNGIIRSFSSFVSKQVYGPVGIRTRGLMHAMHALYQAELQAHGERQFYSSI